jgi:uncharacterized protein (TIGR02145 family)
MKKPLFLTAVLLILLQVPSFGQSIKLNNEGDPGSAMLEVNSSSKGILIPNVSLTGSTDVTTIILPAVSLLVYNTATVSDVEPGYYYNSGTIVSPFWTRLSTSTGTGTAGDGSETKVTAGTNVTVTGSGTSASPYVVNSTEVDGDVTNEIQDLSIIGNALKITLNGASTEIDLSPYLDNTDNQTLSDVLTSNTSAGNNKITSLADPTNAQDAATKKYVDDNDDVDDADASTTNELQNLTQVLTESNDAGNLVMTNLANPVGTQDAATKAYVDSIKASFNEDLLDAGLNGFVVDIEENKYKTIKIGTQVWMAENLRTTKYNDGTLIPEVTDGTAWLNLTTPAYSWYENNSPPIYAEQYGALYNYYTVADANSLNVCPTGWDVPTDAEWILLTAFLENNGYGYGGSGADIGKSMASTYGWVTSTTEGAIGNNPGTNNSSGFAGLPGGFRIDSYGSFYNVGQYGHWWSSSEYNDASYAWNRVLYNFVVSVQRGYHGKASGLSVRCLRD